MGCVVDRRKASTMVYYSRRSMVGSPFPGEVMPMTTYEKVALVLASLQLLAAILALFK